MKLHLNNRYVRWGITAFCVIAASILFYYLMFHGANIHTAFIKISNILTPVIYGMVMAYVLTPVMNHIEYRFMKPLSLKLPFKNEQKRRAFTRAISVLLTTLFFFAAIYALVAMFVSQIVPSVTNLVTNYDTYIENGTNIINKLLEDHPDIGNYINQKVTEYSGSIEEVLEKQVLSLFNGEFFAGIKKVSLGVINVIGVLLDWIIGLIISIYLLAGKERFAGQAKKMIYAFFDRDMANSIIKTCRFTHKTFIGFISGKVLDSIIIGLLCFVGTTLLKTPYAALVSVIIGITNIIPFFGPALGAIPSTILIFLVDPLHPLNAIYFIIFILILQQFDGNILGPKILGESTGLTGFWVIFAITLFGGAFKIVGMIVGVPIFAVIYAAIRHVVNTSLLKKNLPDSTTVYMTVESIDEDGFHEYVPEYQQKIDSQKLVRNQERNQKMQSKQSKQSKKSEKK